MAWDVTLTERTEVGGRGEGVSMKQGVRFLTLTRRWAVGWREVGWREMWERLLVRCRG